MIQKLHFWVYTPQKLKSGNQTAICTPTFTAALFTIAEGKNNQHVHKWMNV